MPRPRLSDANTSPRREVGGRLDLQRTPLGKRRLTSEHLKRHAPECVDVASTVERFAARNLLRAHVRRGPEHHAARRERVLGCRKRDGTSNTEVAQHGAVMMEEDVAGLDISVDHVVFMRVVHRRRELRLDPNGLLQAEWPLTLQSFAQGPPFGKGHAVEDWCPLFGGIDDRQDVWMVQQPQVPDFPFEPHGKDRGRQIWAQNLDRDADGRALINTGVHVGGCPAADLRLHDVVGGESRDDHCWSYYLVDAVSHASRAAAARTFARFGVGRGPRWRRRAPR